MEHLRVPVREARPDDVPRLLELVRELAAYEKAPDAVETTAEQLDRALFGPNPAAYAHAALDGEGQVAGFALWYPTFSTWKGRPGLWLEDLFVQPAARRLGLGRALLVELARLCTERDYARLEWWVLDWNVEAAGFYRSLGAVPQDEWTVWRLDGSALDQLGRRPQ